MACPTPETPATIDNPSALGSQSGATISPPSALATEDTGTSAAPVALTAQPIPEIEKPCADE